MARRAGQVIADALRCFCVIKDEEPIVSVLKRFADRGDHCRQLCRILFLQLKLLSERGVIRRQRGRQVRT